LLVEDFKVVLHLYEPRSLSTDVLSVSFSTMHCGLPSLDGFLFLPEPLNLLLDSGYVLFLCCCFFLSFFIPITNLDVIELHFLRGWLRQVSFSGLP
jgi:hypothetical protein